MRPHAYPLVFLTLLSTFTCFYRLGAPDIDHIRLESRRAEIARNMLESGDWVVPRIAGEEILTKPPLYFWAAALCSMPSGMDEFTARMPSALAGIGTVLVTYLLGALLFGRAAGIGAGLVLLSTNIFLFESRFAELESMLTFFITASLYCFFRWHRERGGPWLVLFFCCLGLGFMTKGPFAFTFPLIPILCWLALYREAGLFLNRRFAAGLLLALGMALPWGIAIMLKYPKFLGVVAWETLAYYTKGQGGHAEPFPYYFRMIPAMLFPWFLALPFMLWAVFSEKLRPSRRENVFFLLYILGNFIFLTGSKSKRDFYLAPLAPAFALITASTWSCIWELAKEKTRLRAAPSALLGMLATGALLAGAGIAAAARSHILMNFPGKEMPRIPEVLLFAGLSMLVIASIKLLRPGLRFSSTTLCACAAVVLCLHVFQLNFIVPLRNAQESSKQFYLQLARMLPKDAPLAWYGRVENFALSFNAHRPVSYVHDGKEALDFMAAPGPRYILFTEKSIDDAPEPWQVVLRRNYSAEHPDREYILVKNR